MGQASPQNQTSLPSQGCQPYLTAAPLQAWVPCVQRKLLGREEPEIQLPPSLLRCQGGEESGRADVSTANLGLLVHQLYRSGPEGASRNLFLSNLPFPPYWQAEQSPLL